VEWERKKVKRKGEKERKVVYGGKGRKSEGEEVGEREKEG
jgi:hypothetical protein